MPATLTRTPLCGAIRPLDTSTICNLPADHIHNANDTDHRAVGEWRQEAHSTAMYRPAFATWSITGTETCNHCGYPLDGAGMCTAPRSAAD